MPYLHLSYLYLITKIHDLFCKFFHFVVLLLKLISHPLVAIFSFLLLNLSQLSVL